MPLIGHKTCQYNKKNLMKLADIIKQQILQQGPISFHDYMEMALYYPGLGYYTSAEKKIGKAGDFFTSSEVSPAFGAMIAKQLEQMWEIMGENSFTIAEYGAGNGGLCCSILSHLRKKNKRMFDNLHYCIIEKSPVMQALEKKLLAAKLHFSEEQITNNHLISWHNNIKDIDNLNGCVLSNELVDNFAVHRVEMREELMEVFVNFTGDFEEVLLPASRELKAYLEELKVELPYGYRTEINLQARDWMREIACSLIKGFVITIDYGSPSGELYDKSRSNGTLTCYCNHSTNRQYYQQIGQQDITAHVNFSALCLWGYNNGLDFTGFRNQGDFLTALGFADYMKHINTANHYINFEREALVSNTLLNEMGSQFKVLIQHKNIQNQNLLGLRTLNQ
jgi:SAM-dependent MidA family methyltransferase